MSDTEQWRRLADRMTTEWPHEQFDTYSRALRTAADTMDRLRQRVAELERENKRLVSVFHHAVADAGWHPGRTDDDLCEIIRAKGAEMKALEMELAERRKSGSAADRLHNICAAISEEANGSAYSREEWNRIDAENLALRKRIATLEAEAAILEAWIKNQDEQYQSELRRHLAERSRATAALGDNDA